MMRINTLNPAQEMFCQQWATNGGRGSDAYRQAYPGSQKWQDATVNSRASELLSTGKVQARIAELRKVATVIANEKFGVDTTVILREAVRIGLSDPRQLFAESGKLKKPAEWSDDLAASIASIEVSERRDPGSDSDAYTTLTKVKFWDKNSALEKLMKHLGMFEKDNAQKGLSLGTLSRETLELIRRKLELRTIDANPQRIGVDR